METKQKWTETIESKHSLFDLNLKEVWKYRDLVYMFVKRDFVSSFKQTILGPIWFFVNPVFTTLMYVLVFGNIAKLSTDGAPQVLFYLSGVMLWNYFSSCLNGTAGVFRGYAGIFGKVYFPRLIVPITVVTSNLMQLGIQFFLFLCFFSYYLYEGSIQPNLWALATPFLVILMAGLALGAGMILSSLTTKYRDIQMLMTFAVGLYMYATPVIYPVSMLPAKIQKLAYWNPLTGVFECFKYGWLGVGDFKPLMLVFSCLFVVVILVVGTLIFNKVEKNFMDTV